MAKPKKVTQTKAKAIKNKVTQTKAKTIKNEAKHKLKEKATNLKKLVTKSSKKTPSLKPLAPSNKGSSDKSNNKNPKVDVEEVVTKVVDDCQSEDNDNDSDEENIDDNLFRVSRPGNFFYGMRVIGYQCLFASKGMTPIGQPPFMVFFNQKLSNSLYKKDTKELQDYHKIIEVKIMAIRKQYPKNVPVEVMVKNSEGSWRQIPQLVYVREVPAGFPNTTASLRQWAKVLAKEVKNQGDQYPVEMGFGRDMTVLDDNNELKSVDTVLMDDDVVCLVKKRYRKVLKNNNGEAFFSGPKLHKYFEAGRNISEIRALFG